MASISALTLKTVAARAGVIAYGTLVLSSGICVHAQTNWRTIDTTSAFGLQKIQEWSTPAEGIPGFIGDLADVPGNNFVIVSSGGTYNTYKTRPEMAFGGKSAVQWDRPSTPQLVSIDYDGILPDEYVSSGGPYSYIFTTTDNGNEYRAVDSIRTFNTAHPYYTYKLDVDGDGTQELISSEPGLYWHQILWNKAAAQLPPFRVAVVSPTLPTQFAEFNEPSKLFKNARGDVRFVASGQKSAGRAGLYLTAFRIKKQNNSYITSDWIVDSVSANIQPGDKLKAVQSSIIVQDRATNRTFIVATWRAGVLSDKNSTVVYEVIDDKIYELYALNTNIDASRIRYLGEFDAREPVLAYMIDGSDNVFMGRISALDRPVAKIPSRVPLDKMVMIDDQSDDGVPDILTNASNLALYAMNLSATDIHEEKSSDWSSFRNGRLIITKSMPGTLQVTLTDVLGKQVHNISSGYVTADAGFEIDVASVAHALPRGMYFIKVTLRNESIVYSYVNE